MSDFSHFDERGEARMVDVGDKRITARRAVAGGSIRMQTATLKAIRSGTHSKGDVLAVARLAGIIAAKRTADLIPLCHTLPLTAVEVEFETRDEPPAVECTARVETRNRTGVEMEALTAVSVALLTIYDMCKGVDRGMQMDGIALLEKSGGRSGHFSRR